MEYYQDISRRPTTIHRWFLIISLQYNRDPLFKPSNERTMWAPIPVMFSVMFLWDRPQKVMSAEIKLQEDQRHISRWQRRPVWLQKILSMILCGRLVFRHSRAQILSYSSNKRHKASFYKLQHQVSQSSSDSYTKAQYKSWEWFSAQVSSITHLIHRCISYPYRYTSCEIGYSSRRQKKLPADLIAWRPWQKRTHRTEKYAERKTHSGAPIDIYSYSHLSCLHHFGVCHPLDNKNRKLI